MTVDIDKLRNIGISAHIDSGKTTLTERMLFYTGRIHKMHEVKGSDGVGATMDSMELERERGITIASAATQCRWAGHFINIIDTPGHVDFTIEVERALRVLDGGILVVCAVAGVQSQSLTVDRQMRRYGIPRLVFINKCDRIGANPLRVCKQLRELLGMNPVLLQLPIGVEQHHQGVVDLVRMNACFFEGPHGEQVVQKPIPGELLQPARIAREEMLDLVSMFSNDLTEAILDGTVSAEVIAQAIRVTTCHRQVVPVLLGTAYKNKGVQPLLDAVVDYLPAPNEVRYCAMDLQNEDQSQELIADPEKPTVALAFKLEEGRYGQLTYLRIYQGKIRREDILFNMRNGKKVRVGRLIRMHADEMEDISDSQAGDIVAMFGVECQSGDTFTDGNISVSMTSMHVPDPVVSLSVHPLDAQSENNLGKALRRFSKEDPTFRVTVDSDTSETVIHGMGELHLEIYLERMRREYNVQLNTSAPQVAYRETITQLVQFDYTHKKQTGGAGQYGRVAGSLEPMETGGFEFVDQVVGGAIPRQFILSLQKGFESMLREGPLLGAPLVQIRVVVNDGNSHPVDSSDMAFREAARGAFRQAVVRAGPQILEPIMHVSVEGPTEFMGGMISTLLQRRAVILGTQEQSGQARIDAEVPLAAMFQYAMVLRSATEGKAEFTMEFLRYHPVPKSIADELIEAHQKKKGHQKKDLGSKEQS